MSFSPTTKTLASVGSALAASRTARAINDLDLNHMLGWVGLARRRSHFWENVGLVAAGATIGAVGALLFAPSSGRETRRRIKQQAERLSDAAGEQLEEAKHRMLETRDQVADEVRSKADEVRAKAGAVAPPVTGSTHGPS